MYIFIIKDYCVQNMTCSYVKMVLVIFAQKNNLEDTTLKINRFVLKSNIYSLSNKIKSTTKKPMCFKEYNLTYTFIFELILKLILQF